MNSKWQTDKGLTIAGIHTGIGKTLCSAILAEALGYDYWKPIQAGDLDNSDTVWVKKHVSNPLTAFHKEAYRLNMAASPHWAAQNEGIEIRMEHLRLPYTKNKIIVETAGGVCSPLAAQLLNIDLIKQLNLPVVLVSNDYLGSINHTLLSIQALQHAHVPILGIVFSGEPVPTTREFILNYSGLPCLFNIPKFEVIDAIVIQNFAKSLHSA